MKYNPYLNNLKEVSKKLVNPLTNKFASKVFVKNLGIFKWHKVFEGYFNIDTMDQLYNNQVKNILWNISK
jgi:hypothetical protein